MTNIQKQLRLNSLLETIDVVFRSGISNLTGDTYTNFCETLEKAMHELDPMNEPDLIARALMTKNLLKIFEINSRNGRLLESGEYSEFRNKLFAALEDESIKNSDNEIAKEIQYGNIANAYSQKRHSNYTFDGTEKFDLNSELLDMVNDTIDNDVFNQELDAEDLVNGL